MPPTVDFLHVCNSAFLTSNNEPCLIGIITTIVAPSFPHLRSSISIATQIRGQHAEEYRIFFEFGPVDGPHLRRVPATFKPPPIVFATFFSVQMVQIFFQRAGDYEARIISEGSVIARCPVVVIGQSHELPPQLGRPGGTIPDD